MEKSKQAATALLQNQSVRDLQKKQKQLALTQSYLTATVTDTTVV
jgi:hypothetical protein